MSRRSRSFNPTFKPVAARFETLEQRLCMSSVLAGDINLDGRVDAADYSLADRGFAFGLHGWSNGDLNSDGVVDGSDYSILDNSFNHQGTASSRSTILRVGPGQSFTTISSAVALAQPGDTVLIDPGTYHEQITLPRSGTAGNPIKFANDGAAPVTIDGTGFSYVWNGGNGYGGQSYIWLNGITFSHSSNPLQSGAVVVGPNSMMNDCTVQYCDSGGIIIQGFGAVLNRDTAQYNGEEGIIGNSCSNVDATGCITRYNNNGMVAPVWANSSDSINVNGLWYTSLENGGGKWSRTDSCTLQGWQSYGNIGQGLSFDIDNTYTTIRYCNIHDQKLYPNESAYDSPGLVYEISYGPCYIQSCTFSNNPGGGLMIVSSSNVTAEYNTFSNNALGLTNYDRGTGDQGVWTETHIKIDHNTFNNSSILASGGDLFSWDANTTSTQGISIDYDTYNNSGPFRVQWGTLNMTAPIVLTLFHLETHGIFN